MIDFNRPPIVGTEQKYFQEALESGKPSSAETGTLQKGLLPGWRISSRSVTAI